MNKRIVLVDKTLLARSSYSGSIMETQSDYMSKGNIPSTLVNKVHVHIDIVLPAW